MPTQVIASKFSASTDSFQARSARATILVVLASCVIAWLSTGAALAAGPSTAPAVGVDGSLWLEADADALQGSPAAEQYRLERYRSVVLDVDRLVSTLEPLRSGAATQVVLDLPLPDGSRQRFRVVDAPVMDAELAAKFPQIRTFSAQGLDDPSAVARLDWSPRGLHAILLSSAGTFLVAPDGANLGETGSTAPYISYDYRDTPPLVLEGDDLIETHSGSYDPGATKAIPFSVGDEIRLYRAAIAAVGEFTQNVGGTTEALAAIVTYVNQVNALWELELGQRLILVDGTEQLIFPDPATDPFVDNPGIFDNGSNFDANQALIDSVIGSENYDIGHLMLWNSNGGVANFSACQNGIKSRGQSGAGGSLNHLRTFSHELGHQFYMSHTWSSETCADVTAIGQFAADSAYEPGSGNTIMSYVGACDDGTQNDNTGEAIFQYHSHNLDQMLTRTVDGGQTCGTVVDPGINTPPVPDAGSTDFTLPRSTPFVLVGSATDAEGDLMTYSWEEHDLASAPGAPANGEAPFFRVFEPKPSPARVFPQLDDVISGTPSLGEQVPVDAQTLDMRLVVRDNHSGLGGVAYDSTAVSFAGAAGPFAVTAPDTAGTVWRPATTETVTWDVAGTDAAPIRCSEVGIDLSIDGGRTYPHALASNTANDGTESVTVPSVATSAARVRVRCMRQRDTADAVDVADHYFFDISDTDFLIEPDPTGCVTSLVVGSLGDSGPCTLRDTIAAAPSGSTITFDASLAGGTITLFDEIEIAGKNLEIDGGDRNLTISGGDSVRLFRFPGNSTSVFRRLTLAEGRCTAASLCAAVNGFGDQLGGAVFTRTSGIDLLFDRVVFRDNQADFGGAVFNNYAEMRFENCTFEDNLGIDGGALYVRGFFNGVSGARTTLDRTTLSGNRAFDDGGAIYQDDGTLRIFNSTISDNLTDRFSTREGGAIYVADTFDTNRVRLEIVGSTLTGNGATIGGGLFLGAGGATVATVTITNTIVANSTFGGDCVDDGVTLVDGGSNLVEDGSCGFAVGGDPDLAALDDNGGFTRTHALGSASPALDAGDSAVCAAAELGGVDQRGYGRPATCDIGAFEDGATPPAGAPTLPAGQTFAVDEQAPIGTVVGTVAASDPDPGQTLRFALASGNVDNAFAIDAVTGQLTVRRYQPLDPQTQPQFQLLVTVVDDGTPPLSDSEIVTVDVTDINRAPTVDDGTLVVSSSAEPGDFGGFAVARDPDPGDALSFAITGGDPTGAFSIDSATGDLFVADATGFDAEPSFTLTVQATDNGTPPLSDTGTLSIEVRDCVPAPGVVSSTADSGPCTLRQTILDAPSGATITFADALQGATITLASEIVIIDKDLVIDGQDRGVTISAGSTGRLFRFPSNSTTVMRRLTLADGLCTNASPCVPFDDGFGTNLGGAILSRFVSVDLLFDRVVFRDNVADFGGAVFNNYAHMRFLESTLVGNTASSGGALYVRGSFNGSSGSRTTFDRSTVSGNRAFFAGGAFYHDDGRLEVHNSTLSGNFTDSFSNRAGGGIYTNDNFGTDRVFLDLVGATLADNSAPTGGALYLGASSATLATVRLANTLLADSPTGGDCFDGGVTIVDAGSNLVEDGSCGFAVGGDPLLGPLAENGGATETHALLPGSPALGGGDDAACAADVLGGVDQRGFARDDGDCDIGAFEAGATPPAAGLAIWDGGGATDNWSEAANWVDDAVPTAGDTVLFDDRSQTASRVDPGFGGAVASLRFDGYVATVTLERSLAIDGDLFLGPLSTLDLATETLTVDGAVDNRGTLRQTRTVDTVGATVEFLRLETSAASATRYWGVDITPTASALGAVVVEVHGDQPRCTSSANDSVLDRCWDITPAAPAAATLRLYYSEAERNEQLANQLEVWHFASGTSTWESAGTTTARSEDDLICVSAQGEACWVEAEGVDSFSPFVAGSQNRPVAPALVPVTLASFEAVPSDGGVRFRWSTATETANIGFRLWGLSAGDSVAGDWGASDLASNDLANSAFEPLGPELIPSRVLSSFASTGYELDIATSADVFYLEDIDARGPGHGRLHGPFELGRPYGYQPQPTPIDWNSIRAEHAVADARRERAQTATAVRLGVDEMTIRLLVEHDGIHRVAHDDLLAAGFDLAGTPADSLALTAGGEPVAIRVAGGATFGAGSFVEFYGEALDSLYTRTNVYRLAVDPALARRIVDVQAAPDATRPLAESYLEELVVERDRTYFTSSPGDDPWYDTWLFARDAPATATLDFALDHLVAGAADGGSSLELSLWGVTSWPQANDHHALASLNGASVLDATFDGSRAHLAATALAPGALLEGTNLLEVTVPNDTGVPWDVVAIDEFTVRYPRAFVARDGALHFASAGERFAVEGVESPIVYRLDAEGPVRLVGVGSVPSALLFADGFESGDLSAWGAGGAGASNGAAFAGTGSAARYVVASEQAVHTPAIEPGLPALDLGGTADYLVIAHPNFVDGIAPLVAARRAQGLSVRVLDVDAVYGHFGHGVVSPQAIADAIAHGVDSMGTRYVLLVGGDTYDYFDTLGTGAMSFVPSLYAATGELVRWAPVDPLYADIDGDERPDVALGRLPVRTRAELDDLVAKTLEYDAKDYGRTSIFAADGFDGQVDFRLDSDLFEASLPAGWTAQRAHLDDIGVEASRQALVDAIEGGVALTSFVGHSASTVWTFDGLFGVDDAIGLGNAGRPTVVSQWGCWNTWYVATEFDTLSHGFLTSGRGGAAAVLGATTLTSSLSERALGRRVMRRLASPGTTLGDAIQAAKEDLAATQPAMRDVLLGWTLLGDPALVVDP